eukprot:scaffold25518_cov74-Phaeocystis_antarctica.AAC.9
MAKVRKKGSLVQLAERARPHTRREAQWLRWLRPKHAGSQRPRGVPARGGWPPRRRRFKPDLRPPGGHQSRARPLLRGVVLACRRLRRIEGRGRIVGEPPPVARGGADAARRPVGETHTQLEKYTRTSVTRLVVALQPEHQRTGCGSGSHERRHIEFVEICVVGISAIWIRCRARASAARPNADGHAADIKPIGAQQLLTQAALGRGHNNSGVVHIAWELNLSPEERIARGLCAGPDGLCSGRARRRRERRQCSCGEDRDHTRDARRRRRRARSEALSVQ